MFISFLWTFSLSVHYMFPCILTSLSHPSILIFMPFFPLFLLLLLFSAFLFFSTFNEGNFQFPLLFLVCWLFFYLFICFISYFVFIILFILLLMISLWKFYFQYFSLRDHSFWQQCLLLCPYIFASSIFVLSFFHLAIYSWLFHVNSFLWATVLIYMP